MRTPPSLDTFVDACIPLAENRDHQCVAVVPTTGRTLETGDVIVLG